MASTHDPSEPPPDHWDDDLAGQMIGKLVLVGLTYVAKDGELIRQEQVYGSVTAADPRRGIVLALEGRRDGESCTLPPQTSAIEPARPGEYRLRSTGETVTDPDFLASWTVTPRDDS